MGQKKTPLLLLLRTAGGTLYVFPSASEDIGLNLLSTTTGVAMSHYALLDIADVSIDNYKCGRNGITVSNANQALSMSLLNYMMNFETTLTNNDNYNYQELSTVSEKAFWHWAKKVGILDVTTLANNKILDGVYKADSVVKCIGSIDAGNTLSTEFGMFNEVYITVPTSYGNGPTYFEAAADSNIALNTKYETAYTHLLGRDDSNSYLSYTNGQDVPFVDGTETTGTETVGYYKTASTIDCLTLAKNISNILTYVQTDYNDNTIQITSFDDINIDTDDKLSLDAQFEFNAILLYYSVYDLDDTVKTAYATNLFGIIFLDGAQIISKKLSISTKTKKKSTSSAFGNSFSFRVNLKNMSVYDNTDAIIQDNTTTASVNSTDFSDAISNLNVAIDTLNSNTTVINGIQDKYALILAHYDNLDLKVEDVENCLNAYLKGTRSSLIDTTDLYVKNIYVGKLSDVDSIKFYTKSGDSDENGNAVYNSDPIIDIELDSVAISKVSAKKSYAVRNYVVEDDTTTDDTTNTSSNYNNLIGYIGLENWLAIKTKSQTGSLTNEVDKNQLYISNNSKFFDSDYAPYLKDSSTNDINYVGLIPYIIAWILIKAKNGSGGGGSYEAGANIQIGSDNTINALGYTYDSDNKTFQSGLGLYTPSSYQFAIGKYNAANTSTAFAVGNGNKTVKGTITKSNALSVDIEGNTTIGGDLTFSLDGTSTSLSSALKNMKVEDNNVVVGRMIPLCPMEGFRYFFANKNYIQFKDVTKLQINNIIAGGIELIGLETDGNAYYTDEDNTIYLWSHRISDNKYILRIMKYTWNDGNGSNIVAGGIITILKNFDIVKYVTNSDYRDAITKRPETYTGPTLSPYIYIKKGKIDVIRPNNVEIIHLKDIMDSSSLCFEYSYVISKKFTNAQITSKQVLGGSAMNYILHFPTELHKAYYVELYTKRNHKFYISDDPSWGRYKLKPNTNSGIITSANINKLYEGKTSHLRFYISTVAKRIYKSEKKRCFYSYIDTDHYGYNFALAYEIF